MAEQVHVLTEPLRWLRGENDGICQPEPSSDLAWHSTLLATKEISSQG